MEDRNLSEFCIKLLDERNYFSWSNDMEIVLRARGMWQFVGEPVEAGMEMNHEEAQKKDLVLPHILMSVSGSCKPASRIIRCPGEAWWKLYSMFIVVSEAAVDAKLTRWQNI